MTKIAGRKREILRQIAALTAMERGKLSSYTFKDRSPAAGPYYKLQQWHKGKNVTHYVRADAVLAVQAALSGYARYRQLTQEYADLVVNETRQRIQF
jgi:hypothetical protein